MKAKRAYNIIRSRKGAALMVVLLVVIVVLMLSTALLVVASVSDSRGKKEAQFVEDRLIAERAGNLFAQDGVSADFSEYPTTHEYKVDEIQKTLTVSRIKDGTTLLVVTLDELGAVKAWRIYYRS